MNKALFAFGAFVFCILNLQAYDCGCAVGKTEPATYEYCVCTDPIELSAVIKTTCNNQKTGSCTTNFVVRNDGINPPANPSGPGKITCDHTNHFDVTFLVTLEKKNDSPTAGDSGTDSSDGGNGGRAKSFNASLPMMVANGEDVYARGTPLWRVGLGQDASGNPSGQIRIEPEGLYSGGVSPSMLRISAAAGKIDVWYHTDWVTNVVWRGNGLFEKRVQAVVDSTFPEQILAKECFVTVSTNAVPSVTLRFYRPDQVEPNLTADGAYALKEGAESFVEYVVTRPEASMGAVKTRITESRNGQAVSTVDFAKETSADGETDFNVYEGGGLRSSCTRTVSSTSVRRTERSSVVGNDGSEAVTERSYLTVGGRELLTGVVRDPDGLARGESYEYGRSPSSPDYGRITRHVAENGLVTEYAYGGAGQTLSTSEAVPGGVLPPRRTVCSYAPLGVRPHCPDGTGFDISRDNGSVDPVTPRNETVYVGDTPVSKILRFISLDTMQHRIIEEVRLSDPASTNSIAFEWSNPANVRTYTDYMPYDRCKPCSELPSLVMHADGTIDRYAYSAGEYVPGSNGSADDFVDSYCGVGDFFRTIVTHCAAGGVEIPNVTTRDVKIEIRSSKKTILKEQHVCTAPGRYARVSWTSTTRDALGQETLVVKSDGTRVEKTYAGRRLASMTDAEGLKTTYTYDALGRVIAETKSGGGVRPDTTTTTTYDIEDRVLSRTVTSGDLSETETYEYDALGRTVATTDAAGIVTKYLYATDATAGLETRTTIRAFGTDCAVTNTVVSYADGRTKETLLNGIVKTAYEYGPNWTKTYEGPAGLASPRWSCSYEDALGRTVCETRPGFRGALLVTSNEYDTANQLVATRTYSSNSEPSNSNSELQLVPLTFTLFCYNSLGQRNLTVSDMNLNNQIDWNDTDRIVSNDTRYVSLNGSWWRESSTWQTRQNDSPELTLMGRSITRLTGLGRARTPSAPQGILTVETLSLDALNNETVVCSYLNRATHTTTQTTLTPGSTLASVTTVQSGLTMSSRSTTGVTTTYAYDALGRQISQTDGRGNTSQIVYDAQGRVAKTIDPLNHETTYAYDVLGRQIAVTDPLGHTVTTAYDAEGRVLAQRGATYPVDYTYDAYGNKVSMTTYRNEDLIGGDTTRWLYDEPSGCMTNKVYTDGKGPRYDYTPDGKLARRVWARGIATDYTCDNAGKLTRTEYNDNGVTPTITMSYDRVGNLVNATTAGVVTNLYAYDLYGQCTNEWQNDFQLTRFYDTLGRNTGHAINGTRQTTIAYDTYGRIATMNTATGGAGVPPAQGGSGLPTASNGGEFTWTYLPGSDLKSSLSYPNGLTASWTYDANNQLLQVRNATPTNIISQFDYTYDAAGRRTAIAKSGSAFGDLSGSVDTYTYNARSELTSARRTKNGQPIPGFSEDFDYDPIGNRRSSATYNEKGEAQTSTYTANNLNQYTTRTTPGYAAVRGEADPNATVTVNENPTFRLGSYYFGSDLFDNSTSGGLASLVTYATLGQTAANGNEAEDLVSAETNQVYLAQSPETFAYDDDGNQTLITTKTGLWRVTYNGENRPIFWESLANESNNQTISNQTILSMSYDHMGRRRMKNAQRFFYDGYLQIANFHSPTPIQNSNYYVWDCTEPIATRPLAWLNSALDTPHSVLYYIHDGNKNVSEVIAAVGAFAAHYEYAPFGAVAAQRGTLAAANPWRFSSEYAEDDTATVYYNYRPYEPVTGRWLSRDPIGESNRRKSLIGFCANSNNGFDYLGLEGQCCCKVCLYSAVDLITLRTSGPVNVDEGMRGHTWVNIESCSAEDGEIGPSSPDNSFSFGPIPQNNSNKELFWGVPGGYWDVDQYSDLTEFAVAKRCWSQTAEECKKIKEDLKDPYPEEFSLFDYCTNSAVDFLRRNGIDAPDGVGEIDMPWWFPNVDRANPKDMYDQIVSGGGVDINKAQGGF